MTRERVLLAVGEHQYGVPARGLGVEYLAFKPALESLGFEVIHFELWNRSAHRDFAALNAALIEAITDAAPAYLLAVPMHYEIWNETLDYIRATTATATICWTTDDSWKYRQFSRLVGAHYDVITTTYPQLVDAYGRDGLSNVVRTQWAAASPTLRQPKNGRDCTYAVSFVGAAHGNRKKRVQALARRGIEIACFGHGWPAGPVEGAEIFEIMHDSVISLNFANSVGEKQIKARMFEVPGAGGFLLTETAPGLESYYVPGQEIETFSRDEELIDKISRYLSDPVRRDEIARAGHRRTAEEHTYERRLEAVLRKAQERAASRSEKTVGADTEYFMMKYRRGIGVKIFRAAIERTCAAVFGRERGRRAARRIVYEASWRIFPKGTYSASGLPGRIFPDV